MLKGFENIKYWIFDLDETLYPPESHIAEEISKKITEFLMLEFGWEREHAYKIQREYYYEYGSTIQGLIKEGHVDDAQKFETFVHDVDFGDLHENKKLDEAIKNLPGKKYVLTTSQSSYAKKILDTLGILGNFEVVWGIEETDFIAKPNSHPYEKMINEFEININEAAMVEDSYKNAVGAKKIGLRTIWIDNGGVCESNSAMCEDKDMSFIDMRTTNIVEALREVAVEDREVI